MEAHTGNMNRFSGIKSLLHVSASPPVRIQIRSFGFGCCLFICFHSQYVPTDPRELANRIFVTCYMGTENSSEETRMRASNLAEEIGSYHMGETCFVHYIERIDRELSHGWDMCRTLYEQIDRELPHG